MWICPECGTNLGPVLPQSCLVCGEAFAQEIAQNPIQVMAAGMTSLVGTVLPLVFLMPLVEELTKPDLLIPKHQLGIVPTLTQIGAPQRVHTDVPRPIKAPAVRPPERIPAPVFPIREPVPVFPIREPVPVPVGPRKLAIPDLAVPTWYVM